MEIPTTNFKPEPLPGGTVVFTTPSHRFGTDALLLANFCVPYKRWSALDLGSGSGILLLTLLDRGLAGRAVGVELDEEGSHLLSAAIQKNGFANAQAVHADLRTYRSTHLFDLIISNPPYFSAGPLPPKEARARVRHETFCNMEDLCYTAAANLKDNGRFCLCYPANRLASLFASLAAHNLAPKRLQLARKGTDKQPWLALVDARKAGGEGLSILPDIILTPGNAFTYTEYRTL